MPSTDEFFDEEGCSIVDGLSKTGLLSLGDVELPNILFSRPPELDKFLLLFPARLPFATAMSAGGWIEVEVSMEERTRRAVMTRARSTNARSDAILERYAGL